MAYLRETMAFLRVGQEKALERVFEVGAAALALDLGLDPFLKLKVTGNSLSRECCLSGILLSTIM